VLAKVVVAVVNIIPLVLPIEKSEEGDVVAIPTLPDESTLILLLPAPSAIIMLLESPVARPVTLLPKIVLFEPVVIPRPVL
jgi:hypothetical protein